MFKKMLHHKNYACVALLIWLAASLSGMHGHYCFDGLEPAASVHFDLVDMHSDEHSSLDKMHIDVDNNPSQTNAIKLLSIDLPFIAFALLMVFVWPVIGRRDFTVFNTPSSWITVTSLRPPLRAPPAISV